MPEFSREQLNQIAELVDIALRADGLAATRYLSLLETGKRLAAALDAAQEKQPANEEAQP